MFEHSESGVLMVAVLDTRRANKDGHYPVKIRVTYRRERKYYGTGKFLSEEGWARLPEIKRRVGESKYLFDVKDDIQVVADKIKKNIKELVRADLFSFEALNKYLGNTTGGTLNGYFIAKMDELQAQGKVSTCDMYKCTLNTIIHFERGGTGTDALRKRDTFRAAALSSANKVNFQLITPSWLKRYEAHMVSDGKSYTTIAMYMKCLQSIINTAKDNGIIKAAQYPFGKGKYEIPDHEGRNIALSLNDIGKIVKYKTEIPVVAKSRDLWFFSYLCNGANFTDLCKLKFSNIQNDEICFYRQKTITTRKKKKLIQATIPGKSAQN